MIYRFVIISDEVENFRRDIRIDASATFLELNNIILESVGYDTNEITRFLMTDKVWHPKQEILLMDMGATSSDKELYLMAETCLDDLLEDEGERLLFNFDMLGDRYFYMELREVQLGENLSTPEVVRSKGEAPDQHSDVVELLTSTVTKQALGAKEATTQVHEEEMDEFSSETYDPDELDTTGFELTDDGLLE